MNGRRSFLSGISRGRRVASLLALALSSFAFIGLTPTTALGAPSVSSVQPSCAGHGDQASLVGSGLNEKISVSVAGKRASIVEQSDTAITFVVPNNAKNGDTEVVAVLFSRGSREEIARLPFRVASDCPTEGVLLEGPPDTPASDALFDLPEPFVAPEDIEDGLILTRLNAVLSTGATVGDVNAALESIGGRIVGMETADPLLEVSVPRQTDEASMQSLADTLLQSAGITFAWVSREVSVEALPPSGPGAVDHLTKARFTAAWNAKQVALGNCSSRVQVVIPDHYNASPPPGYEGFFDQVPHFSSIGPATAGDKGVHGFDVASTMAAAFDSEVPTGANPFSDCLDVRAVRLGGLDMTSALRVILDNLPPTGQNGILNFSIAYQADCGDPCGSAINIVRPIDRFADAAYLRLALRGQESRILITQAAGNFADKPLATIYPGLGIADHVTPFAIDATALAPSIAADASLWNPDPVVCPAPCVFPPLVASPADVALVEQFITDNGLAGPSFGNVAIVGSATLDGSSTSSFSNSGASMFAVGEAIPTLNLPTNGTSFSAPQVAGLASYLWLLSPTLKARPVQDTLNAIAANAFQGAPGKTNGLIDAYQTVLSLDEVAEVTVATAPVRLSILDVDDQNDFDIDDVTQILNAFDEAGGAEDFGRFDLNGDGFTGGSFATKFDLDPSTSVRFGAPDLKENIVQNIDIFEMRFDETSVTDGEVLCYYAWSDLYTNDAPGDEPDPRLDLLRNACPGLEGAEYVGTIRWDHFHSPDDADTQSVEWHVVANLVMTLGADYSLLPTGDITFDLIAISDCGTETISASGGPTGYTGTFTSPGGELSGSVSGGGQPDCTPLPDPLILTGVALAEHVYTGGVLTSIDFNRNITFPTGCPYGTDPGCSSSDVFTGELTLQPIQ